MLTYGSLFSGIGGIDLGLDRAGMRCIWQSEIDPFASSVLAHHWPDVPNLGDITTIDWSTVERPDLICGGFPCQDLSTAHTAGQRAGLAGPKSGLWSEYRRCLAALAPRWVLIENVATWRHWLPDVRADLAALGYASVPMEVPAGAVGAPHRRRRVFVVGNSDPSGEPARAFHAEASRLRGVASVGEGWPEPPRAVRVDDGLSGGMDRCRALGNAVVPRIPELIGRRIIAADRQAVTA